MLLVDTNVLLDVVQNDDRWAAWSISQLRAQSAIHALVINPVIYAELSMAYSTVEGVDDAVDTMDLVVRELTRPALFLAAKAHIAYWQRGGVKLQVLPDFFIGAQAAVEGWPLLTRDAARYRTYFPGLTLLTP